MRTTRHHEVLRRGGESGLLGGLLGRCLLGGRLLGGGLLRGRLLGGPSSWPAPSSAAVFLAGAAFLAGVFAPSSWRRPSWPAVLGRRPSWPVAFLAAVFLAVVDLVAVFLAGAAASWPGQPSWPAAAALASSTSFGSFLAPETTFFRSCAGRELRHRGLLRLDARPGLRVAHPASLAHALLERAEAGDRDLLALGDLAGDGVENALQRLLRCLPVPLVTRGERVDEL